MTQTTRRGIGSATQDAEGITWYWPTTDEQIAAGRRLVEAGEIVEESGECDGCEQHEPGHRVPVFRAVTDGERLRARRKAAGLTQAQLAARLRVARPRVAEWESGTRNPSAAALVGIEAALATPPAVYVVGSDAADLDGWTPETLAAALVAPLGEIGVAVECRPRESGVGLGLDGLPAALRESAQAIVERVVADGP